jgi:hypothetical protein
MAKTSTIKDYLVSLGFDVDNTSARHFQDSLKSAGLKAEKFTKDMTIGFVAAGGAIATVLTAIGAGTISMMTRAADMDLSYQMFARRMYMTTDAARTMKIALDALGVSPEELIWGPPELAQRYNQLVKDQADMIRILGGDTGEKALRKIRDIEFQFTRMGPEVQRLGITITEDIMNKLFGGAESLENRLKDFNEWFKMNIPRMGEIVSGTLVPAFREVAKLAKEIWEDLKLDFAFLKSNDKMGLLFGDAGRGVAKGWDFLTGGDFHTDAEKKAWWSGDPQWKMKSKIAEMAAHYKIDPAAAFAIANRESGMNPNAPRGAAGEIGMFQVMPATGMAEGFDNLSNLDENIMAAMVRMQAGFKKYGYTPKGFAYYNGSGPMAEKYGTDVFNKYKKDSGAGAQYQPQSYTIHVGGIHINQPNATPEQVKAAVHQAIADATAEQAKRNFAMRQGVYA